MVSVSRTTYHAANLRVQEWPPPTWVKRHGKFQVVYPPEPGLADLIVKRLVEAGVELMSDGTPEQRAEGRKILMDVRRIQKRRLRGEW